MGAQGGDVASDRQGRGDGVVVVQQSLASLTEIPCGLEYDEEDRQGEALRPQIAKTKKRTSEALGQDGEDATRSSAPKKRKARRRGRNASGSTEEKTVPLRTGSVDWKAVVSEFAM